MPFPQARHGSHPGPGTTREAFSDKQVVAWIKQPSSRAKGAVRTVSVIP